MIFVRLVNPLASRIQLIVASVPLLTIHTRSIEGTRLQIISAIFTSSGCGIPKLRPFEAAPQTAGTTASGAWPRMAGTPGPHVIDQLSAIHRKNPGQPAEKQ